MTEASLEQHTTEEQVGACLRTKSKSLITLYIGSSDPIDILSGVVERGQPITTVTGGCEYPLALLLNEPSALHLCDLSPVATAAAEVKLRCVRTLNDDDYRRTWPSSAIAPLARTSVFERHVLHQLSPAAKLAAEFLADPEAIVREECRRSLERRNAFAFGSNALFAAPAQYSNLQVLARQTAITLRCAHVFDLDPPAAKQPHTLYLSNVGIVHDHTLNYAARLAQQGWPRVLYTANEHSRDDYGTRMFAIHNDRCMKSTQTSRWEFCEGYYRCGFGIVGYQGGAEFPVLLECTPKGAESAK